MSTDITRLLADWREGDERARDRLFQRMYEDLRRLAHFQRGRWHGNHTLNTTALVHELYVKLAQQSGVQANDRAHFNLIAGKALRHILVDYAKMWTRQKRGGDAPKVSLDEAGEATRAFAEKADEILGVNEALARLAAQSERLAQVVEMHFFGGFTYDEIADALGVTKRTVSRDWVKAKAWLRRELRGDGGPPTTRTPP